MRAVFLITLVAFGSFAQGRFDRTNQRTDQGRSKRGFLPQSGAFFEFAPPSGAGMGTACACAAITGAKGEALTFTRTGNATCSRQGLATTGIANGDLAVCTANQPRVESSGGVLGLRVEGARTNEILRSQEIDNAAWSSGAVGVAAPTVTANAATAPDGTVTAERLQAPLTTGGQYSYRLQVVGASSTWSYSLYVRGNGTSGTMHVWGGSTPNACVLCSYNSTSWTRCTLTGPAGVTGAIGFGNDSTNAVCVTAGAAASALDVFVWQAQSEQGSFATSPIPTVAAAVTRNAEAAYLSMASTQVGSMAATGQVPYPSSAAVGVNRRFVRTDVGGSDTNRYELYWASNATVTAGVVVGGVGGAIPTTALQTVPGTFRVAGWRTPGSTAAVIIGGTQTTAADAQAAFPDMNRVYLGAYAPSAGFELDGIVSQVQVDPSITRAR